MKAFIMKLDVFKEDVLTGGDHHFQTLKHFIYEWEDFDPATLQSYADFISQIANEFQKRFSQFQGITAVIDLPRGLETASCTSGRSFYRMYPAAAMRSACAGERGRLRRFLDTRGHYARNVQI